ncbi:MAG: RNA polymerase factor sigma-54 [Planctomycetes bacterium]|nr:RNA polymerase factor sigma-54 [Planctomycetota bacterium]
MALHLGQNLNMRMEQKLKLTPQMIQSIEILLLPQMALEERIMSEVESNPALEMLDGPDADAPDQPAVMDERGAPNVDGPKDPFPDEDLDWFKRRANRGDDAPDKMEALASTPEKPPALADHLLDQLRFQDMPAEVRELIPDLCWQLDRRGYLEQPLSELFAEEKLELAEQAWEFVRGCDPAGIGARDLKDCLMLQLVREPGDNSFEMMLIRDHLDDVLKNRLPAIASVLGVDVERVQEGVQVIATLDPKPGLPYASGGNQYVVPDVVVERDEAGEWIVSVPDGHLPKVQVSQSYWQLYDSNSVDPKERAFLKDKLSGAKFIVDAVAQRKRTLLKIVSEIIKHQTAFLEQGPEHLRPLMRQNIADIIGMHVATVSRAVKDKYIQTPGGVIPLASFFSGGIANQDGSEAESSKAVKLRIQKLIQNEDAKNPLSDQEIADLLDKDGLDISRRTVTKYRIADGIPSTRQRRSF